MKNKLSHQHMAIAVIGLGSIGLRHAKNALQAGCRVVGYDPDTTKWDDVKALGMDIAPHMADAINQADAVIIATPTQYHIEHMALCVMKKKPMLVEKPLSHTVEGVEPLLAQARKEGVTIAAAFNLRFRRVVKETKKLLEDGMIGHILWGRFLSSSYLPEWRLGRDYTKGYAADKKGGGVLLDVIHEFDLANYLMGPARTVAAYADNSGMLDIPTEDRADVILKHASGATSNLHLDYITRPRRRQVEIAGTEGMVIADLRTGHIVCYDVLGNIVWDKTYPVDGNEEYQAELEDFLGAIKNRKGPSCTGEEALSIVAQVIEARKLAQLI